MENKNICSSCGTQNEDNARICSKCGAFLAPKEVENSNSNEDNNNQQTSINTTNNNISNEQTNNVNNATNNNRDGNKLGIIALLLYFVGPAISGIFAIILPERIYVYVSTLIGLCTPAAIVTMIVGRVKYPKNTLLKVAMWIIIICTILSIIAAIIFIISCYLACKNYDTSGCN